MKRFAISFLIRLLPITGSILVKKAVIPIFSYVAEHRHIEGIILVFYLRGLADKWIKKNPFHRNEIEFEEKMDIA